MIGSPTTRYFYELTPDRILAAFEQAGIRCQPAVRFLNSLENRVAQVEDEDGERWVGKFYRPGRHSRRAILEEHAFLQELWDEGIPVIPPVELRTGPAEGVAEADAGVASGAHEADARAATRGPRPGAGIPAGRPRKSRRASRGETIGETAGMAFAIFPHRPGRPPDELDGLQVDLLGDLLARVHNVGARHPARERMVWDPARLGEAELRILGGKDAMPPDIWARYERSARRLIAWIAPRLERTPMIRIHGDFHRGNLLWGSLGPILVDFDDMTMGPPIQDVWMLVPGRDAEAVAMRQMMLHSYERRRPFDRRTLELVEPLRALRFIRYAAWITARRQDPAFRRVLHDYGSRSYWRSELTELEAQMELFM